MRQTKLIIYDCDGVLFDSKEANKAFYNHILKRFSMPLLREDQLEFVHMSTAREAIDYLFRSAPWIEEAKAYLQNVDNTPFISLLRLEPNIRNVLEYLRPKYNTAIATNRGRSISLIIKEHGLDGLFDLIVTALDVQRPKPHPECLVKILKHFDVEPNEAMYIGDSKIDRLVSESAGVPFAAYKNPNLKALYYFDDHMDLLKVLPPKTEGVLK